LFKGETIGVKTRGIAVKILVGLDHDFEVVIFISTTTDRA